MKRSKRQRGGVSFNAPISIDTISNYTYPYNLRMNDPQSPHNVTDSRILNCSIGGKKHKKSTRKNTKKHRKKQKQKQKGGSLSYSLLPGTCNTNDVFAIGSSSGSEYIKNTVLAEAPTCNTMTSQSSISTLA
jgi:hypothetical protein